MPKHTITIDYGYDVHSVEVDEGTFAKIVAGEAVSIDGQGFLYEGRGYWPTTGCSISKPMSPASRSTTAPSFQAGGCGWKTSASQ